MFDILWSTGGRLILSRIRYLIYGGIITGMLCGRRLQRSELPLCSVYIPIFVLYLTKGVGEQFPPPRKEIDCIVSRENALHALRPAASDAYVYR